MWLTEEDIWVINKYMRRCSTSLVIREMQIKTTLWFHITPIRIAIIKNTNNNRCWGGCGKKTHFFIADGAANWCSHSGKVYCRFLRKLGMDSLLTVIPFLGLYPKDVKSAYYSNTATKKFITAQFTIARLWNQTRCPLIDEWINWSIYTQWNISQP